MLRPKPFAVLAYLATHASRLVSREELAQAVWPDTHVGDGLLRGYVRDVRTALGDDAAAPRFIETVARLGYRFLAPVRPADDVVVPDVLTGTGNGAPRMVGRAAELRDLARRLALAIAGRRQLVLVTGEPGIGKTTLVDAFLARAIDGRDVWTARGQCVEHFGAAEAYLPVLEALGRLGRLPGGEQLVAMLARHAPTWLVQMPGLITDAELETVQRRVQGATQGTHAAGARGGGGGAHRGATPAPGARGPAVERRFDARPALLAGATAGRGAPADPRHVPTRGRGRGRPSAGVDQAGAAAARPVCGGRACARWTSRT